MDWSAPLAGDETATWYRPMTRCECAEISFEEVARRVREHGLTLDEVRARTGCGECCTACLNDLRAYLGKRA